MTSSQLDVLSVGEALIDFVALRGAARLEDVASFRRAPGGAPANVAVGVARLGDRAGFFGRVGEDVFGRLIQSTLTKAGVDTSQLRFDPDRRTGLAFVNLGPGGERSFEFFRHPAADLFLDKPDLDPGYITGARVLHFGSLSLAVDPCRSAVLEAVRLARSADREVSFDVNLRPALWPKPEEARERILAALPLATILKVSEEEAEFLRPGTTAAAFAAWALGQGVSLVAVTLGAAGCVLATKAHSVQVPGFRVEPVDTTGAGDGFLAGLLHGFLQGPLHSAESLRQAGRFANAVGALTVTRRGAIPALPSRRRVEAFLGGARK